LVTKQGRGLWNRELAVRKEEKPFKVRPVEAYDFLRPANHGRPDMERVVDDASGQAACRLVPE